MTGEITRFDSPIDVMFLIHKALSIEAAKVQKLIEEFEPGESLQPFKLAFNFWASLLACHAEAEDKYMTAPLVDFQPARDNETEHVDLVEKVGDLAEFLGRNDKVGLEGRVKEAMVALTEKQHIDLMEKLQDVLDVLNDEIGKTKVIARTQRHLYGRVVTLRIAQDDHFENEEAFVLPEVRDSMNETQQLYVAKKLLVDEESEHPRWILDWLEKELTPGERKLLADMEAQFGKAPAVAS